MAKQIHVSMTMDADTKQAKAKIAELQQQLQQIKATPSQLFDDANLKAASKAASELQQHLRAATDVDTGKLNLSQFSASLTKSGKQLKDYKKDLELIGPTGQQAFISVARSIASAESPTIRLNKRMTEFLTTLKNTARWQISSSILHGFMGSVSSAYGYAQKLDKSLNNIRIVTGKSAQEMAEFAKQANKSARALSASTVAYSDAALIFYQQGLEGDAVTERADTVIKMTNVTGESAEEVSSYMTAIWNNFANGSKELEYYADVITALGAATASSTDEIAAGLEKFAAISETVGLSYEYATTALATVTAETRQSADVVGTAFKTIFSRIQGLQLGETLEDGTDLNKYSSALLAVGINIKDANGELRDMDDILDELGTKWGTLHRDEQLALAQTVAGVRQYNQLISLMDNWGIFKDNLNTAMNSEGELNKQADIYADSWEAAKKRVQAAAEEIYDTLIDENFFKDLANAFEKILNGVNGLIKGFGGVKGILGTVGGLITLHLAKEAPNALNRIKENLMVISGHADKLAQKQMQDIFNISSNATFKKGDDVYNLQLMSLTKVSQLKQELLQKQHTLNSAEREAAEISIQQIENNFKILETLAQQIQARRVLLQEQKNEILNNYSGAQRTEVSNNLNKYETGRTGRVELQTVGNSMQKQIKAWEASKIAVNELKKKIQEYMKVLQANNKIKVSTDTYKQLEKQLGDNTVSAQELLDTLKEIADVTTNSTISNISEDNSATDYNAYSQMEQEGRSALEDNGITQFEELDASIEHIGEASGELQAGAAAVEGSLDGIADHAIGTSEVLVGLSSSLMSLSAVMNSVKSFSDLFSKEDATFIDYLTGAIGLLTTGISAYNSVQQVASLIQKKVATSKGVVAAATAAETAALNTSTGAINANTAAWFSNPITAIIAVALLAVVATIGAVSSAIEKNTQKIYENGKAASERLQTTKEETKTNQELIDSFLVAHQQYEETGEMTEELTDATDSLTEAYNLQYGALAKLSGEYDNYIDKIKEAREEEIESARREAEYARDVTGQAFMTAMRDGKGYLSDGWYMADFGSGASMGDGDQELHDFLANNYYKGLQVWGNDISLTSLGDADSMAETYESVKQFLQDISTNEILTSEQMQSSELYTALSAWVQKAEETYNAYVENLDLIEQYTIEENFLKSFDNLDEINNINTVEEYMAKRREIVALVAEENGIVNENSAAYKEIEDAVDAYLNTYSNLSELSVQQEFFEDAERASKLSYQELIDLYNSLSEDDQRVFFSVNFDDNRTEEEIRRAIEVAQNEANKSQILLTFDSRDGILEALASGKTLTEDQLVEAREIYGDLISENFTSLSGIDQLRTLTGNANNNVSDLYNDYAQNAEWKAEEEKRQQFLEYYETYIERTQALRDQIGDIIFSGENGLPVELTDEMQAEVDALEDNIASLEDQWNQIQENFGMEPNLEMYNPIAFEDIDVDITYLNQLSELLQKLTMEADGLRFAAESIGEGFIVAAEDVRVLANMYPELLDNSYTYEDGRVQLDSAAVKAILGNESELLKANADATVEQIQNKIALVDAEIAFYERKRALLESAMNGDITYAELQSGLEEATNQYKVDMTEWATNCGMDASEAATIAYMEDLNALDKKIEEISHHYAAMLSGDLVTATEGMVPTRTQGFTADDYEGSDFTTDEEYMNWLQAQLDSTDTILEGLATERANLITIESEIKASLDASTDAMTGAMNGLGGKIDKDSGKKKEKEIKKLDDEIDRYHEIKELLEDIGVELNRIQKKKDRAWGGGKLAAINEETAALKQQLSALKQYQSQIESNLSKDKGALGQYGWSLDGNGNVSNYEANMARLVNQWNNSAQEQADKDYFENAKKALQQYEESKDLYDDVIDQITDATYALADAELEAIEYSVEIHLELDDNKLKLLEDIMETIGDSAARAVDNIEMIEKSIDTVLHQMETSKDGMKSIFDYIGLSGDVANRIMNGTASEGDQKSLAEILNSYGGAIDMDRVVQDLQQYQDNLLSYNEALRNYRDQVFETVNNAFTEHLEDFDRANDKIAHCVNLVSGYKDLIEAIGRKNIDVHGELTQKLNQALEAQAEDAHRAALAKEKYAQSAYQEALEGYQTAIETGDEYAINKWTEILETAQDELQAAKEDSQAALTEWANAIAESFSDAIQQVIDDLDTALGGLKLLREDFDMAQEIDAQYLDDYEKIYQLSKLTREVQASMDETDNVAAKKALMEYQSKINAYQQQGVQMSQYELDYLRAQYELELARIALEESKNAKSQVSMVKDAEGNYSYVYTADDEAVAEAEQTYEDRLYEMQRLNGDYINELQSNIITMQEEMSSKLEEIANNDLLSYEEKMLRMDEVRSYYLERIHFYDSQLGISIENNKELYDNEWTDYSAKTGYKISANEDYVDSWEETTLAILTNVETQEDYFDQLEQAINHATEEAENCCERAQDALNEAGMTTEELGQTISQTTDELIRDADDAANSAEQMSDEYQRAMQEIMNAATTFTSAYASMISSTIAQNQSLIASMQSVIQMALQMKAALAGASSSGGIGGGSGGGSGGSGSGGGNSGQASSLAQSALTLLNEVHHGKYGTNGWIPGAKSAGYDQRVISLVLQALNDSKAGGGYDYFYDKAKQLLGFNTGGYTGNWGTSQGRLALLHQKELVLNAQDTPNILDAVGIVRDIAKAIDINALSAMVNGGLTAATFSNGKEEVLEQNVHITAEFPNATDKHEILEAFDNVINLAAQYANRKN